MAERLKIAFVVDRFGSRFGGAEAYGVELMRQFAAQHDVTVFAHEYDPACDLKLPFVPVRGSRRMPSWLRVLLFAVRARRLTRTGYDIVHSHMNGWCGHVEVIHVTPVRYNWRVRPLSGLKRGLSYLSLRVQTYLHLEQRRVAPRIGHRTVAVSGLIAQQLRQAYPGLTDLPVIPPGVAPVAADNIAGLVPTRESLGYWSDDLVCLLVARNPLRKGLPAVLDALALLPPQVKLLVVGGNAAARAHVARREGALSSRVQVLSETSDVAPYYRAADVYVHATLNDSFGMAPLEAMSFGLPVVLSPAPWCGFAEYVAPGTEALLLDHPENSKQLAEYVERLRSEPELRDQLRRGGAQVVARHGWRKVAERYEKLYQSIMEELGKQVPVR